MAKPDTSSPLRRLSASEIASLRADQRRADEQARAILAAEKQAGTAEEPRPPAKRPTTPD